MATPITNIFGRIIPMIRFNRFNQRAALSALLLCFSLNSPADDIQDANKLFKQGQAAQALTKLDNILVARPKEAQARFLKGLILTEQGQTEGAIRIFTALTVDYPELPEPYNNLAVIYASQGLYEKAKTALETALRTHPSYSTAHENLGDIYAKMASQAYDRAFQLDRSNANTKTKLALIKDMVAPTGKSTGKTQIASIALPAIAATSTPVIVAAKPIALAPPPVIESSELAPVKPLAATPAVVVTDSSNDAVLTAVQLWAQAWSARNANKYLAMYAKDFNTPNNETRAVWEQQRRERLDKPQAIAVTIINPKIILQDETQATVHFVQSYLSGKLKSSTHKTLVMTKINGAWQIQSEQTGTKR